MLEARFYLSWLFIILDQNILKFLVLDIYLSCEIILLKTIVEVDLDEKLLKIYASK